MGSSISVNHDSFATEVLQKSFEKPVLVDFFAQWCGPCKMLSPILEKLVQEYDFVLAKVDIDENADLASTYQVEGVPDVRVAVAGELHQGFVGVLPEPRLRDFLAQLNLRSTLDTALETIYAKASAGDRQQAIALLEDLLNRYPDSRELLLEAANFYIELDEPDQAEAVLAPIQDFEKEYAARARGLKAILQFKQIAQSGPETSDLDQQFQDAARAAVKEDYQTALEGFLAIVSRDRKYRDDGARKAMISVFELIGDDHPLTGEYRKKLMMALY